jgi:hypothetical protein
MVRRRSPARVRKRALQKPRKSPLFSRPNLHELQRVVGMEPFVELSDPKSRLVAPSMPPLADERFRVRAEDVEVAVEQGAAIDDLEVAGPVASGSLLSAEAPDARLCRWRRSAAVACDQLPWRQVHQVARGIVSAGGGDQKLRAGASLVVQ